MWLPFPVIDQHGCLSPTRQGRFPPCSSVPKHETSPKSFYGTPTRMMAEEETGGCIFANTGTYFVLGYLVLSENAPSFALLFHVHLLVVISYCKSSTSKPMARMKRLTLPSRSAAIAGGSVLDRVTVSRTRSLTARTSRVC